MWINRTLPFLQGRRTDSKSLRKYAQWENERLWQDIYTRYFNVMVNLFRWEGLPSTIDPTFLESLLLFDAEACIVFDPDFNSYLGLPTTVAGNLNIYYQASFYRAYSLNYSKTFLALTKFNKDIIGDMVSLAGGQITDTYMIGCVCRDNPQAYRMTDTLEIYTTKMVNAMRAIDVVQSQAKLPVIIETDEDTKIAVQQAIKDIDSNVLAVYASKDLAKKLKETKNFPTQFNPAVLDILWAHKNNLESEMLTAFGLNNLNTNDKKERLLTDEIKSNNQAIAMQLDSRLATRELFCENLQAAFGWKAKVVVNDKAIVELQKVGDESGTDNKDTRRNSGNT